MARPQKNTVDYFPFYCEEGKKMYYLEETYGNDGFATFIKILRELAKTDYHYLDLSKKPSMMFLSAKCKVPVDVLESIINDLAMLGKFDTILWNENKIIWCQTFIDSIQDAYLKRSNTCITYNSLLQLLDSLGVRKLSKSSNKPDKCNSEDTVNTQTILKKTKEDNIEERKLKFATLVKGFESDFEIQMLRDFYMYWSEHSPQGSKMRYEKEKVFDVKRRLDNWAKRSVRFDPPKEEIDPRVKHVQEQILKYSK